jgi:hypothetical protein
MFFALRRPCANCPFREDCLRGWLGRERAGEIADTLRDDRTFACHKTTRAGGSSGPEQHCAGALIVLEREGMIPQLARIAGRLGFYDPDALDPDAPVFDSLDDFVEHHADG